MRRFDAIAVIDWSAAGVPRRGKDSIWSAWRAGAHQVELLNHPTRRAASRWLRERLLEFGGSVLVGCDFSFGYPEGFVDRALPAANGAAPWARLWAGVAARIEDDEGNRNNRFVVASALNEAVGDGVGPLWGCPPGARTPWLSSHKAPGFPAGALEEYRVCEQVMRQRGHRVFSSWQLYGAGSVGSQMLTGIPMLERLRRADGLAERTAVWPFETGFTTDPCLRADAVVMAEVWPGLVPLGPGAHPVRDAAQVLALSGCLHSMDGKGQLGSWFAPGLAGDVAERALDEEGWILGAGVVDANEQQRVVGA